MSNQNQKLWDYYETTDEAVDSVEERGVIKPVVKGDLSGRTLAGKYKAVAQQLALDRMWYAGFCCGTMSEGGLNEFTHSDDFVDAIEHLFAQQDYYECDKGFHWDHFRRGFERAKLLQEQGGFNDAVDEVEVR